MEKCNACKKALGTSLVLQLEDGELAGEKILCPTCAEKTGIVQGAMIKNLPSVLESLLAQHKNQTSPRLARAGEMECPGCGMTAGAFKKRGRLGCKRCFEAFQPALTQLLENVHEGHQHRGRFPGKPQSKPAAVDSELLRVREDLSRAIAEERFEEAARLRDRLNTLQESQTKNAEGKDQDG